MHTHGCHRNMFQKLIIEEETYRTYTVIIEICQSTNVEIEIYWTYMVTQHLLKICTQWISYCEMQRPTFAFRLRIRSKIYRRKFILHWCKFIVHWCKFGLWWILLDGEIHILKIYVSRVQSEVQILLSLYYPENRKHCGVTNKRKSRDKFGKL